MSLIGIVCRSFTMLFLPAQAQGYAFLSAAVLLLSVLAAPFPSHAGDVAPYFTKNEFNGDPRDNCSGTTNPIDIRSLNKYHEVQIFRGKGEFPLEFSVFHNARHHSEVDGYKMVHGKWTFSYGQRLYFLPNYEIEIVRPDGRSIFFKRVGVQYQGVISDVNAGTASVGALSRLPTGQYQYKRLDGVVEYFDSRGGLQKLVHRSGAEQNVVQSGLWGGPTKITVTHSNTNQSIEIRYNAIQSRYGDGTAVANFRAQEGVVDFVAPSGARTQFKSDTKRYYLGPYAEAPVIYSTGTYTVSKPIPDTIPPLASILGA